MPTTIVYTARATVTITLASLANASMRQSAEVSNSSAKYVDVIIAGKITTGTSPTNNNSITVFAYGGDGTIRSGGASGTDSAYTPAGEDAQLKVLAVIPVTATSNQTYEFYIGGLAQFFGNAMPEKWGIIVSNDSGVALNATGSNHEIAYQGVQYAA